jgi:Flp pilus assembly protein TadD
VVVLFALVAVFGILTLRQTSIWASDFALASRGIEVAPRNNMAANNYAKELALRGEFASAVPIFHQVIERRPNYWLPTFNLGFVYYQLGDLAQAERYLRRAISIFPNDAAEHRYLGFALLEMKRNAEAETELRAAITLQPNVPDQHFAWGMILEEKGELAEALGAYKKEREINPKQPEVNAKIATLESLLHQPSPK